MCQTLIQDAINWLTADPTNRYVAFYLTSNEATITQGDNLISYATGSLTRYASGYAFWGTPEKAVHYRWERLSGRGLQAFNDRGHFDRSQRDEVELSITLSAPGPNATLFELRIDLALVTWGGGQISLSSPRCEQGVIFAHADGSPDRNGTNRVGYTLTLKNGSIPG